MTRLRIVQVAAAMTLILRAEDALAGQGTAPPQAAQSATATPDPVYRCHIGTDGGQTSTCNVSGAASGDGSYSLTVEAKVSPEVKDSAAQLLSVTFTSTADKKCRTLRNMTICQPVALESETPASRQMFVLQGSPQGDLEVRRLDMAAAPDVSISIEKLVSRDSVAAGYAARLDVSDDVYRDISVFGRCTKDDDPEVCPRDERFKSIDTAGFSLRRDAVIDYMTSLIAELTGWDPTADYKASTASLTSPFMLFIGVNGINQVVMLDCQKFGKAQGQTTCIDYARPSARTLQRASFFWAGYIEDADAPFSTTVDVEFGRPTREPDYEEFDPRVANSTASPSARHRLRIGLRRFRVREAPTTVQVAFSRQGPGYGLRQWVRVYEQKSKARYIPAGSLFVPGLPAELRNDAMVPLFRDGVLDPIGVQLVSRTARRGAFAMLSIQWPQVRARADDARTAWLRFARNLPPDLALGLADGNTFFTGVSWPVPLVRGRSFVTVGYVWTRVNRFRDGFADKQRLPPGTRESDVLERRWEPVASGKFFEALRVGLTVDIFKLRK